MPVDMFLKIDGVQGESRDKAHCKEIDVLAWSWGVSNSGSAHQGGGAGAGKVNVQDVSLTKYVDSSSPKLLLNCCEGTHYDTALLTIRKAGGTSPVEYVKLKMEEVMITSVSTGGTGPQDRLTETVSLNFATIGLDYTPQDAKGAPGTAIPFGWNIIQNVKA
jgi:type VI secretion system secreted protein Hcp